MMPRGMRVRYNMILRIYIDAPTERDAANDFQRMLQILRAAYPNANWDILKRSGDKEA